MAMGVGAGIVHLLDKTSAEQISPLTPFPNPNPNQSDHQQLTKMRDRNQKCSIGERRLKKKKRGTTRRSLGAGTEPQHDLLYTHRIVFAGGKKGKTAKRTTAGPVSWEIFLIQQ